MNHAAAHRTFDRAESARIDLDAYFERIGYAGERTPTLDTLRGIQACHPAAIAFENLNPLLGWPVRLDARSLQQKLVVDRRGGYCFEHNLLLGHVLNAVGFSVSGLAARVLWKRPADAVTPRSHMLLRLSLDGVDYVADVGFGGSTLTGSLRLELDTEQVTPHEPFRLSRAGCDLVMEIRLRDGWQALYRFDLQAQLVSDYEITSWYLCHHPDSHFRAGLIAARSAPGRRYTLRDTELAVHHLNGPTERRVLTTAAELRATLEDTFRLRVPQRPEVRAAFERLTSGTPEAATA